MKRRFDELKLEDVAESVNLVTDDKVRAFAAVSGDINPVHLDEGYASTTIFRRRIAHGILSASFISALIAEQLPGEGSIYLEQSLRFVKPVYIGDTVVTRVQVVALEAKGIVRLKTQCFTGDQIVIDGTATVKLL